MSGMRTVDKSLDQSASHHFTRVLHQFTSSAFSRCWLSSLARNITLDKTTHHNNPRPLLKSASTLSSLYCIFFLFHIPYIHTSAFDIHLPT